MGSEAPEAEASPGQPAATEDSGLGERQGCGLDSSFGLQGVRESLGSFVSWGGGPPIVYEQAAGYPQGVGRQVLRAAGPPAGPSGYRLARSSSVVDFFLSIKVLT